MRADPSIVMQICVTPAATQVISCTVFVKDYTNKQVSCTPSAAHYASAHFVLRYFIASLSTEQ